MASDAAGVRRAMRQPPRELRLRRGFGDDERSRLGASLIRHRIAADLTQRQLAQAIGVSCRCVQSWETDMAWPTVHKFAAAAEALGTTMDRLWWGDGYARTSGGGE